MPRQTSMQLTQATEAQITELKRLGYGSTSAVIRTAVDRMHQTETAKHPTGGNPMRRQGQYFSISDARLSGITAVAQLNDATVTAEQMIDICLDTDWPNAADHQRWLDTAPSSEIAHWAVDIHADVQSAT